MSKRRAFVCGDDGCGGLEKLSPRARREIDDYTEWLATDRSVPFKTFRREREAARATEPVEGSET